MAVFVPVKPVFTLVIARLVLANAARSVAFVTNVDVRNEFDTAASLLNKILLPVAEI